MVAHATACRGRKPSFHTSSLTGASALGTMNVSEIARHVRLQRMAAARFKADSAAAEASRIGACQALGSASARERKDACRRGGA
jgi:hypothetical protein